MPFFSKTTLAVVLFFGGALCGTTNLAEDSAVTHFKLPRFGEDGYKIWEVRGTEGKYKDETTIFIKELVLRVLKGGEKVVEDIVLQSPSAEINPQANLANSEDSIFIRGEGFTIQGTDWLWNGKQKSISIQKQVEVTFNQNIIDILE